MEATPVDHHGNPGIRLALRRRRQDPQVDEGAVVHEKADLPSSVHWMQRLSMARKGSHALISLTAHAARECPRH